VTCHMSNRPYGNSVGSGSSGRLDPEVPRQVVITNFSDHDDVKSQSTLAQESLGPRVWALSRLQNK
jgi:hypothetical protein